MDLSLLDETPRRTSFADIALAIQAQVVKITGLSDSHVKLIGRNNQDVPKLVADRDVLIRPSRFDVGDPESGDYEEAAAGLVATIFKRTVYIFPRVRMGRDETNSDRAWLTSEEGLFRLEEMLLKLHEWTPLDDKGRPLTCYGLKIVNGTEPDKDLGKAKGDDSQWGDSCLAFSAVYLPPISPGKLGVGE